MSAPYDFNATRDVLIEEAMGLLGILPEDQTPSPAQLTKMARSLNLMLKSWQARGYTFWTNRFISILPQKSFNPNQQFFTVRVSKDADYASAANGYHVVNNYYTTNVTTAATSGTTVLVLNSAANLSIGSFIGVSQSTNVIQWTTVANLVGTTVTLSGVLAEAVVVGARVYYYSLVDRAEVPIKLIEANSYNVTSEYKRPMQAVELSQVQMYTSVQNTGGVPVQISYQRLHDLDNIGTFYIWPGFSDTDEVITCRVQHKVPVYTDNTTEINFPEEMYEVIKYGLAVRQAPNHGLPVQDRTLLKAEFAKLWEEFEDNSNEDGSIRFVPAVRQHDGR